jgi:hypothetical protein
MEITLSDNGGELLQLEQNSEAKEKASKVGTYLS